MLMAFVVILVALTSILLGLIVFLRNRRSAFNVAFAIFAVLLGLWIPSNFFGSYYEGSHNLSLFFYADFMLAPLMALAFVYYGYQSFKHYKSITLSSKPIIFTAPLVLVVVLSLSAVLQLVATPVVTKTNVIAAKQSLYWPYIVSLGIMAILGLLLVIYSSLTANKTYKNQTRIVLIGIIIASIPLLLSNVVLTKLKFAQTLSYLGALILLISLSYSIIKHKLFDIKLVVARSLAYILALGTLSLTFGAILLAISSLFFSESDISLEIKATFIFIALLLAFLFQPLKKFFDRLSNSLFYRDAYDSQELLNSLNRSLVTTINLEELLNRSSKIIGDTLKTEYCEFAIRRGSKAPLGLVGAPQKDFDEEALNNLASASNHVSNKTVVADELATNGQHLKEQMQKADVAVLLKLQGKVQGHTQHPGYILLGQKKSGGLFSSQDIQILEIIADELVIAVQNALRFEEIQQFNITLQTKIEAATKQLRVTNAKLKALDAAKDEFISMASHQLRTPLTAIKGYLSLILDGDTGPVKKDQKAMIQQSFDGAQRMVYLIADLLNVSRMQTGKFVIDAHPANLSEMIPGEMAQLKEQAEAKQITMNFQKPQKFPWLNLDETKVRQVIMNFLDNALYYTPKGGQVDVKLLDGTDSVVFEVTDTGVGVPKAVQHNLFTKFYRADNARKMRPDGTGLGLFMAKKVVVAQGGAIIFNSVEGKGSTFGFSFPKKTLIAKSPQASLSNTID